MASDEEPLPGTQQSDILRGGRRNYPLHPMERRLVVVLCLHLCFMPWALGAMFARSGIICLSLSVLAMWFALAPRKLRMAGGGGSTQASLWPRLVKFPLFWAGLALVLYVFMQGWDVSWTYGADRNFWWLSGSTNVYWLPAGVKVGYYKLIVWHQAALYADAWLMVCAVWVGITRRQSLRVLLSVLVANALALCAFLVWQRVEGAVRTPESIGVAPEANLTASFLYRAHAGAYFSFFVFSALGLATWYFENGRRQHMKKTPSALWAAAGAVLAGAVLATLSRGAIPSMLSALAVYFLWLGMRSLRRPYAPSPSRTMTCLAAAGLVVLAITLVHFLDFSDTFGRFGAIPGHADREVSVSSRVLAQSAAVDMIVDRGLKGIGAGCFRYLFPEYAKNYPDIYQKGTQSWDHAYCDWLEIPIELGLPGILVLLFAAGWGATWFVRRKFAWHPLAVPILLGGLATLLQAGFDFPFQGKAILVTWCTLLAVGARWVALEAKGY